MKLQRQYHKALDTHTRAHSMQRTLLSPARISISTLNICKSNQRQRVLYNSTCGLGVCILIGLENNKFSCWLDGWLLRLEFETWVGTNNLLLTHAACRADGETATD